MNHVDDVFTQHHTDRDHEGKDERRRVKIELNGEERKIPAGKYTGQTLKVVLAVPVEHELDEVVKQEFRPIANDQEVRIEGGEKFVSHCGQGQSS